jgi:hypothetical protein
MSDSDSDQTGCCSVGFGGPYQIAWSGLDPGCNHPWHISWLPHGYGPTKDDYVICLIAPPPTEDWSKFGLGSGERPPLIDAIIKAIEGYLDEKSSIDKTASNA